ncbi:hypothetical protein FA95DRAFT_1122295 [Auriscalpium vulgare]|uniref:Uncharacterized protein n=1 Tax=Auriscalpium vulgare TaxID=40419 RepID=A0ACB8R4V1_9AGAM|nr:hypothetical protein FA95DRAFT_1122295 [Auriscalpium vulgare]
MRALRNLLPSSHAAVMAPLRKTSKRSSSAPSRGARSSMTRSICAGTSLVRMVKLCRPRTMSRSPAWARARFRRRARRTQMFCPVSTLLLRSLLICRPPAPQAPGLRQIPHHHMQPCVRRRGAQLRLTAMPQSANITGACTELGEHTDCPIWNLLDARSLFRSCADLLISSWTWWWLAACRYVSQVVVRLHALGAVCTSDCRDGELYE